MIEAVVRELSEETGLVGVCGPLVGWVERIGSEPEPFHYAILDFEVTILDDASPQAGDDASEAAFVPLWEVEDKELVDGLAAFLAEQGIIELRP